MIRTNKILWLILFFGSIGLQAQVNESFSDGDFTTNPIWGGDAGSWKVLGFQLNSNASTAVTHTYLSTPCSLAQNTVWEFYVDLKFATSSVNYTDIFLISDSANLEGMNSGFFVRIGNTSDDICLYRKDASTITKIIDGLDGRVGSTSANIFRIKVTRFLNNEFRLYEDPTGTGNSYLMEGNAIEPAYQTSSWFGFVIKFSSANTQKFFFDDINVNTIVQDTSAPKVDSAWISDSLQCIVQFNEPIDTISLLNIANYNINGISNPLSAKSSGTNNTQVILEFANAFQLNTYYDLNIKNLKDLAGNLLRSSIRKVKYYMLQEGDLVINEIFADPSPTQGLPAYEFIELWNRSGNDINLQGFSLTDGSSTATFPNFILLNDSFLIVSATTSLNSFAAYGRSITLPGFPGLNNDGDDIKLLNRQSQIIDEVSYDLSWYSNSLKSDGGWTLEMIHPKLRCKKKYNWGSSQNNSGGTPGKLNSIYDPTADTLAPWIVKLELINDSMAWLIFNSTMDSTSVSQMTINSNVNVKQKKVINRNADSLLLQFYPLQNQVSYTFTFSNSRSCNGINIRPQSYSFSYDKAFPVQFKSIVISEVLINPLSQPQLPSAQYIELYNRGNFSVNLKGMKISDGISVASLPDYKLMRDSFIIIASSAKISEFSSRNIPALFVSPFPYLNIDNDKIILTDSAGLLINTMTYDIKALNNNLKAKGGWSIELIDADNVCQVDGNWLFSNASMGGTPGKKNSVAGITHDNKSLKLIRAYNIGYNEAVFIFNKGVDLESSRTKAIFDFNPPLADTYNLNYFKYNTNQISLVLSTGLFQKDTIYHLKIKNIMDCNGMMLNSAEIIFGYPSIPQYEEIVINEILFNAASYASEFVEVYNNSDKIFDLKSIALSSNNKYGLSTGTVAASDIPLQLLPRQYIALCTNNTEVQQRYYSLTPENIYTTADWKTLDDDSGLIILSNPNTGAPIDSAIYSKNWHHPFISNDDGISLERVSFGRAGTNHSNWLSAASSVGYATPAYQNSKYNASIAPDEFVFLPNTYFTPDNDGTEDELNFSIVLPSANYSLNITVYDIGGNEIKKIARNDIAAVTNYYSWDGRTTGGGLASTGHYILLIQAIDGNGGLRSEKKVVDLLMK